MRIAFPAAALSLDLRFTGTVMAAIESPCTKVCVIHAAKGLCLGCGRSLREIAAWTSLSGHDRTRVMADLPRRLAAILPAQPAAARAP